MKKFNYALIGVVFTFSLFIFYQLAQFPAKVQKVAFGPSFFPQVLLGIIAILLVLMFLENRRSGNAAPFTLPDMKMPACMMGLVGITTFVFEYVGFIASGFVFLLPAMFLLKAKPKTAIITSILVVAFVYIVFKVILRVPLPVGSLWEV